MPDQWEFIAGLNPIVDDADLYPDGNGRTNLQEFLNGGYFYTNPNDPDTDGDGLCDGDTIVHPDCTGIEGVGLSEAGAAVARLTPEGEKLVVANPLSEAEVIAGSSIKVTGVFDAGTYRLYLTAADGSAYTLSTHLSASGATLSFIIASGLDDNNNLIPAGEMAGQVGAGEWYTPQVSDAFTIRVQRYLNIHNGLQSDNLFCFLAILSKMDLGNFYKANF